MKLFGFFPKGRNSGLKEKLSVAAKKIDIHRRELDVLRGRLESRRQFLFETTVKAFERKDEARATVYANEHTELKRVARIVTVSELALTQIIIRLESIMDVGDVIYQMNSAFRILKKVSKTVSGMGHALENATEEVNTTLTGALQELSTISPSFSLNVKGENEQDLVRSAKMYAEEKAMELGEEIPSAVLTAKGDTILDRTQKVALLAAGDEPEEESFSPVIISKPKSKAVDENVYNYVTGKQGQLNLLEASSALNLPADEIEQAVLKLASEGKIKLG